MRKLLVSVAIATATIAAVPAAAQYQPAGWSHQRQTPRAINQLDRQLDQLEHRIQRAAQRRTISYREAASLRRDAMQIRNRLHRASRHGINRREFAQLQTQVNRLEQRIRHERRDRDGRRG